MNKIKEREFPQVAGRNKDEYIGYKAPAGGWVAREAFRFVPPVSPRRVREDMTTQSFFTTKTKY